MPLIKCPECGKEVSNKAHTCPHCGFPIEEMAVEEVAKQSIGEPIFTFKERRGRTGSILAFVLLEVIIGVCIGLSFTNMTALVFALIFGSCFELGGVVGFVTDMINITKLNRMVGKSLYYSEENRTFYFTDWDNIDHAIKIEDICQFDGPSSLRIVYRKEGLKFRQSAILGCLKKEDVLKLREFKEEKMNIEAIRNI